ncbi:MAG: 2-amino-4-hydroxy-6-hydroxymethyldihydropteridine diphosphokinase [Bacteroidales bacterium]|nr:2-amino-4-hydroxy-6-hydroxymethyldihydropteridine diphosphokinase [Bacteroidales bacterium]
MSENGRILVLLGSNLGNRELNLKAARALLAEALGVETEATEIIETEAVGFDGPPFLNQILWFERPLELKPEELLEICQAVEVDLGRPVHEVEYNSDGSRKYVSRSIDIDILKFGTLRRCSKRLIIPHPQCREREFVKQLLKMIK